MKRTPNPQNPLKSAGQWDDFIAQAVYPNPNRRAKESYRNYARPERDCVRKFYRLHHKYQTFDFALRKEKEWLPLRRKKMSPMDALMFLNTLVDDSDPDIELDQLQHLLQTAEAIRRDGREDWFILTGLLHDLGKTLCLFGEPQWAVVGDTHPVGCRFSGRIVYAEFFKANPDARDSRYNTKLGVYQKGCGLQNIRMSWGHDEYMFHVLNGFLPEPALYMIRYHSFYAWHRENEYSYLCDSHDREMLPWVRQFNLYDLYTKCPEPPRWEALKSYYRDLIGKYLPAELSF